MNEITIDAPILGHHHHQQLLQIKKMMLLYIGNAQMISICQGSPYSQTNN